MLPSHFPGSKSGQSPITQQCQTWARKAQRQLRPNRLPRHLFQGPLTKFCRELEPESGAGREVWPILGRCFLGSQGSRAQSRKRGGLGSCSIRPVGLAPWQGQTASGAATEVAGPRRMCWVRAQGLGPAQGNQSLRACGFLASGLHPHPVPFSLLPSPVPEGCP
jgi:hypothetical protein